MFQKCILKVCIGALIVSFLSGCADLKAIQKFAAISSAATDYQGLIEDYIDSPSRQAEFVESYAIADPQAESPLSATKALLAQIHEQRLTQKEGLLVIHQSIADYMDAIGSLAADDLTNYDKEVAALSKAVKDSKIPLIESDSIDALERIATILFRVASDSYRQQQLNEVIDEANEPLQKIITALKTVINRGFREGIMTERRQIEIFYEFHDQNSNDPAGRAALAELKHTRLSKYDQRINAIDKYVDVLEIISSGHTELFDNRKRLNNKVLFKRINAYSRDLRKLYSAIQDLL